VSLIFLGGLGFCILYILVISSFWDV
jgi:hypothetical protein